MRFWQYKVEVITYEDETFKTKCFAGLVVGENMVQAVEALDAYYGDAYDRTELVNILTCKAITDGVFEFETVQEDGFFDYKVVYAPKNE